MPKKFCFIFTILICIFVLSYTASASNISAKGASLIEVSHGDLVYAKNENARLPMASTTKIMTALVVLENSSLDDVITIEPSMVNIEGSSIYLHVGEKLTVEDLLYALLLESANDASVALAIHIAGDIDAFAQMMNEKALEMGLVNTNFKNPHGLDDDEHYTTAYELGMIAKCAMENEKFVEICSTYKKSIPLDNGEGTRLLINHNKLLRSYEGAIGIKTGFTRKCGRCLVSCASKNGVTLICVTLNDPNDWQDHKALLDYGFSQYENVKLASPGDYSVEMNSIGGEKTSFIAENTDELSVIVKGDTSNIYAVLEANRLISAPIRRGDYVGKIIFYNNNQIIGTLPLFSKENIGRISFKKSLFERLFSNGKNQTSKILY